MAEKYSVEASPENLKQQDQSERLFMMETSDYLAEEDLRNDQLPKIYSEKDNDLISLMDELENSRAFLLASDLDNCLKLPLKVKPQGNLTSEIFPKLHITNENDYVISERDSEVMYDQITFEVPDSWNEDFERPKEFVRRRVASESIVVKLSESSAFALEFDVNISVKGRPSSLNLKESLCSTPLSEIEDTRPSTIAGVIQERTLGASDPSDCSSNVSDELEDVKRKLLDLKKGLDKQLELRNQKIPQKKLSPTKSATSSLTSPDERKINDIAENINELINSRISSMTLSENVESSSKIEISDKNGKLKSSFNKNWLIVTGGALCVVAGAHTVMAQESSNGRAVGIAMLLLGSTMFLKNL